MKTKKIYVIRHGQTDYNKNNMVQGRGIDAPLNELGIRQADAFYQANKDLHFDKIYTSSLVRTVQSVDSFIKKGIPHEPLVGLDEISWGSHEGEVFNEKMHANYLSVIQQWNAGNFNKTVGDGETPIEVMERQKVAMEYIMSHENEDTILIAMHGRAMRVMLSWLLNYPLSKMDVFEHQNLCLYQLHHTGSFFSIEKFSDTTHLKSIVE